MFTSALLYNFIQNAYITAKAYSTFLLHIKDIFSLRDRFILALPLELNNAVCKTGKQTENRVLFVNKTVQTFRDILDM